MQFAVFIQNEAGSHWKHYHDEKTLEWKRKARVSRPYPYPYGFVIGTTSPDGCNVDCFVITQTPLRTGQIVDCDALGLMEQIEDGEIDHNILARLESEDAAVNGSIKNILSDFVLHVFDHVASKEIQVGRFLSRESAEAHIDAHRDQGTVLV